MNANEIMNKIEELKNDEAIYANKNVLDDMATFIRRLNDLIAFKAQLKECYAERDNEFLTFAYNDSTRALVEAIEMMMRMIMDEEYIEERLIRISKCLESFREYSKEELAQYEKMKSYFENKE